MELTSKKWKKTTVVLTSKKRDRTLRPQRELITYDD